MWIYLCVYFTHSVIDSDKKFTKERNIKIPCESVCLIARSLGGMCLLYSHIFIMFIKIHLEGGIRSREYATSEIKVCGAYVWVYFTHSVCLTKIYGRKWMFLLSHFHKVLQSVQTRSDKNFTERKVLLLIDIAINTGRVFLKSGGNYGFNQRIFAV